MTKTPAFVFALLVAIALGYVAGIGRGVGPSGRAFAGPTPVVAAPATGQCMTSSADGTTLVVWALDNGKVTAAVHYDLNTRRSFDSVGGFTADHPTIWATPVAAVVGPNAITAVPPEKSEKPETPPPPK